MLFRFDDISPNTPLDQAAELVMWLKGAVPGCSIMWCISPLAHDCGNEGDIHRERIYPRILNARSDFRSLYRARYAQSIDCPPGIRRAAHGLWHIDHRLMCRELQEASILTSCSLADCCTFVPPFNKWNQDTATICSEHGIGLIRFEDGWKSMEHEPWDSSHGHWYLHPRFWTHGKLVQYMGES